jgi:cytochrome oxidase assembly protein ShyY1
MDRMAEKQELMDQFNNAPELGLAEAIAQKRSFAHVQVSGGYQVDWHLLLDNKLQNGRAGVHVLTLFRPDHSQPILVNRGWLPLPPDRGNLPEIPTPTRLVEISGILAPPVEDGFRLGEPEHLEDLSGALITYLR